MLVSTLLHFILDQSYITFQKRPPQILQSVCWNYRNWWSTQLRTLIILFLHKFYQFKIIFWNFKILHFYWYSEIGRLHLFIMVYLLTQHVSGLQSNPIFRCKQYCNVAMQYSNIDIWSLRIVQNRSHVFWSFIVHSEFQHMHNS